jgi:predicted ferric reductase
LIILANLVTVLVLCFYGLDTSDVWEWENVGYRTGFISICQLPLIFLLAGRRNIIGYLVDMSYARLNWFHRWAARTLWLTSTIHMGFWFHDWGRYDYIAYHLTHDPLTKRGFAAWCILTFIVISSSAPVRKLSYEIFLLQHLVSFVGFIVAIWMHAPAEVKIWVWIPIALAVFDRVVRYAWGAYANIGIFHGKISRFSLFPHYATLTPFPGNVTRVTLNNPGIVWKPGQHILLTCHRIALFQSHPFTIASLPEDGRMDFFIRRRGGGTRGFEAIAKKGRSIEADHDVRCGPMFIEGPYGTHRPLRQFNSVVLFAGGMGATFVVPLLRDIVSAWKSEKGEEYHTPGNRLSATDRIRFIWAVKSRAEMRMFEPQIRTVLTDFNECRRLNPEFNKEIEMSIHVTRDKNSHIAPSPHDDPRHENSQTHIELFDLTTHSQNDSVKTMSPEKEREPDCEEHDCERPTVIQQEEHPNTGNRSISAPEQEHIGSDSGHSAAESTQLLLSNTNTSPTIHFGRPSSHMIIRKSLERAEGESAVIVCGPPGLADDVRLSVVALSDERAVHKGTGAQGIYLHVENFEI